MSHYYSKSARAVYTVWMRNLMTYKRNWVTNVLPRFFEPLLYLLAMGFGLGGYLSGKMGGASDYLSYMAPGLVAVSAMNGASFETTYNMFIRMNFENLYSAYLATPCRVQDIILGEILFAITRAVLYAGSFVLVLFVFQLFGFHPISSWRVLFAVPALMLIGGLFAVIGAAFTSLIKSIELYAYYFSLFLTPMFLFSGIFYPVTRFPYGEQIAWFIPLYHAVRLMRGIMQGPWQIEQAVSLVWLCVVTVIFYSVVPKFLGKKLVD